MPQWTPEQLLAIERVGCDLLVSANAGSGKTAVLVERVIRLVLDAKPRTELDQFLIVTFTEAAASEMREKIGSALRLRLAQAPHDDYLRRQSLLLEQAQISTIHAFCLAVLRQHFHLLGIDPEFSIISEEEGRLLRAETVQAVISERFESGDALFTKWIDSFGSANPESPARQQILRLHHFLQTLDCSKEWVEKVRNCYPLEIDGTGKLLSFSAHAWFAGWQRDFDAALDYLKWGLGEALQKCRAIQPKYEIWIDAFLQLLEGMEQAAKGSDWDHVMALAQEYAFPRMASIRDKSVECEQLKEQLDALKKFFCREFENDLALMTPQQASQAHADAAPVVHLLLDLTEEFSESYAEAKRQRCVLDFSDLEQLCLRVLQSEENPGEPSEAARYYQDQFEHVLVDEYQDINPVQNVILNLVSRRSDNKRANNLFAVGDVKQCIYEFRLAEPAIFLEKYLRFPACEPGRKPTSGTGEQERIDLNRNFRSRDGVLHGVNYIFRRIMTRSAVGLDYDQAAMLQAGATYPPLEDGLRNSTVPVEVCLLEADISAPASDDKQDGIASASADPDSAPNSEEEPQSELLVDWEAREREAFLIGRRILEMVGAAPDGSEAEFKVLDRALAGGADGADTALRPVSYRDIVILMRSVSTRAETFVAVLNQLGIPVFADLGSGYFAASEIRDMLALLQLIDNPLQDIPLASVLRSPLENWSETEMALVRKASPEEKYYHKAFCAMAEKAWESGTATKAADFLARLEQWRTRSRREPLADLISAIYNETGYLAYVTGLPGGAVRRANLFNLYERACQFDQFSRQGLSRFLRFIGQLQEEEGDFGVASPMAENQNAVRIMSIHKSKGLEFPVVFAADLGKMFNLRDTAAGMIFLRDGAGLGVEVTDLERSIRYPTPALRLLQREKRRQQIAEEMRILYVALTRARERLVLTASVRNLPGQLSKWLQIGQKSDGTSPNALDVMAVTRPMDWIGMSFGNNPQVHSALEDALSGGKPSYATAENARFCLKLFSDGAISTWKVPPTMGTRISPLIPLPDTAALEPEAENKVNAVLERIQWLYPHLVLTTTPSRILSSEMKRLISNDGEAGELPVRMLKPQTRFQLPDLPPMESQSGDETILSAESVSGGSAAKRMQRGVITHLVLQKLDLLKPLDYAGISVQVDRMIDQGLLDEEQRRMLDIGAIERYIASPLGQRVLAVPPDRVWREVPFSLGLSPTEAGIIGMEDFDTHERVALHGVIDCLVEEEDGLLLIDYKLDNIPMTAVGRRTDYYRPQMKIYQKAVRAIFPMPLKESYLYYLSLGHAEAIGS